MTRVFARRAAASHGTVKRYVAIEHSDGSWQLAIFEVTGRP